MDKDKETIKKDRLEIAIKQSLAFGQGRKIYRRYFTVT